MFKDGAFTSNNRDVRRFAIRKVMRNIDLAAELGAKIYVCWGGREGAEYGASQGRRRSRWTATRRPSTCSASTSPTRATTCGSRSSPSPTSRAATSCCRPSATRWRSSRPSTGPSWSASTRRSATRRWPGLNAAAGYAQALWQGKLFHIDLNGQNGPKYDQDLRFGAGNVRGAFWVVDTLLAGGYDGPVHFDYKPVAHRGRGRASGSSAKACIDNYLILREKVAGVPGRPRGAGGARRGRGCPSSP